jgi:hypothetical protein
VNFEKKGGGDMNGKYERESRRRKKRILSPTAGGQYGGPYYVSCTRT